ncbi:DUF2975 domain-containing protein [Sporosarcina koreensis]|uniref:DUF2975 domain-containing protein n=1 Tax=Sporosarcina koreensis TaxID=334735 RepID=A0ABW0TZ66_9BACL
MKRKQGSILFLKLVVLLIGIPVLALCIFWLPGAASRDAIVHPETAYLQYPFLLYAYALCIPFFIALYQAFKLLTFIHNGEAFSRMSVRTLKIIKHCAISISILMAVGIIACIALFQGKEDITGVIMLGLLTIFASSVIATIAFVLQKLFLETTDLLPSKDHLLNCPEDGII